MLGVLQEAISFLTYMYNAVASQVPKKSVFSLILDTGKARAHTTKFFEEQFFKQYIRANKTCQGKRGHVYFATAWQLVSQWR